MERQVLDFARGALRPELFNRITERIVFRVLGLEVQRLIIRELIEKKLRLLSLTLGMALTYDAGPVEAFIYRLNKKGGQGARSLKQEVDRELNRAALPWVLSEASPPEGRFCFNNGLGHLELK